KEAYGQLSPEEQVARAPLGDILIGEALLANNSEIERSSRWPLWRYTRAVNELFECELTQGADESDEDFMDRCAESRASQFSGFAAAGGGIARMTYSPAMVMHFMRNYGQVLDCSTETLTDTWCGEDTPCDDPPENFSRCFATEFPADAGNPWAALDPDEVGAVAGLPDLGGTVVIKATWSRVGFGFELPAFDTNADALTRHLAPGADANWGETGDRSYGADAENGFPTAQDIYTIETRSGAVY